jgi:glycosyltransferase involved in cell wall biosynthesis
MMRILAWPNESKNPYTPLLYSNMGSDVLIEEFSARKLLRRYALWHVHWPESLLNIRSGPKAAYKLAGFFAAVDFLRWRGAKIVWTIHNLKAHEAIHPSLEARFWRHFIPRVDGAISLSETGLRLAKERFPALRDVPTTAIPHGHYRDEYPQSLVAGREVLGIPPEARVILFFGAVRAYKNVDALVRAFRDVSTPDALLYIVGRPNTKSLTETILKLAAEDRRVRLVFEFVKPEDVSKFMQAADLVVLPYRAILNSGSALLSLSLNKPVLVPDLGSMGDLRNDFGSEWVRTFSEDLDSTALESALDWAAQSRPAVCCMPEKYNWRSIRAETLRFYRLVVAGKTGYA